MKMKEVMPTLLTDGAIFKYLNRINTIVDADKLGVVYFSKSGNKSVNTLVENYIGDDGKISDANIETLGVLIAHYFDDQWSRVKEALLAEYSPIENYDRTELSTHAFTGTDIDQYGRQTHTIGSQTHEFGAVSMTDAHGVTSYNSTAITPDSQDTHSETVRTNTDGIRNDEDGARSDQHTKGTTETINSRVHGNVGVTTNQQMINAELELRKKNLIDIVMRDIDGFLCLKVYE